MRRELKANKTLLFLIMFLLLPLAGFSKMPLAANDIIVTEIMINPEAVSDTNGEWFEIYNNTDSEIDLAGCNFRDSGTNSFTVTSSLLHYPHDFLVLGRNNDPEKNGGLLLDYVYSGFTLTNSEDEIIITCSGEEIDRVEYSDELSFPTPVGAAIALIDLDQDNNSGDNWCTASNSYGLGDQGSPGGPNQDCQISTPEPTPPLPPPNRAPQAEAGPDQTGTVGQTLTFSAADSSDPDGDQLSFIWDFGDGQKDYSKTVKHQYQKANIYLVTLTVDDSKVAATDSLAVTIIESSNQGKIIINELLPNPVGADETGEWIELKNDSEQTINLEKYYLTDASQKKFVLTTDKLGDLQLTAGEFLVIFRSNSKIALNNTTAEDISIFNPQNQLLDKVSYQQSAKENWSLARQNGNWQWTASPTPGSKNIISSPLPNKVDTPAVPTTTAKLNEVDEETIPATSSSSLENNCSFGAQQNIIINELWPSPRGDDRELEFIEIYNPNEQEVNICGFAIQDKNHFYTFPTATIIPAQEYFLLNRTDSHISLNNKGDTITLTDPQKNIIQTVSYPQAPINQSWSRLPSGDFNWTNDITPGDDNSLPVEETGKLSEKYSGKKENEASLPPEYIATTIKEISSWPAGSKLTVTGTVSCPPGILGSQIMYLEDEQKGLQAFQYYKDWPKIVRGDRIKIKGIISYANGLPRLKIKKQDDIVIIQESKIRPQLSTIDGLDDSLLYKLLTIKGEVVDKKKNKIVLTDNGAETTVYLKPSTGLTLPEINESDIMEITGILNKGKDGYLILPCAENDLLTVKVKGYTHQESNQTTSKSKKSDFISFSNYLYITLSGIIIIYLGKIFQLKKAYGHYQKQKGPTQTD